MTLLETGLLIAGIVVALCAWLYPKSSDPKLSDSLDSLRDSVHALSESQSHATQAAASADSDRSVLPPDGITLGSRVILVPGFQTGLFSYAGRVEDVLPTHKPAWIKRHEVVARYHLKIPRTTVPLLRVLLGHAERVVEIRSPVDGLVLHSGLSDVDLWPSQEELDAKSSVPMALSILLPDYEPSPEPLPSIHGPVIEALLTRKAVLKLPSPYWSMPPFDDDVIEELFAFQNSLDYLFVEVFPHFQEYLDWFRKECPELRPALQHLIPEPEET